MLCRGETERIVVIKINMDESQKMLSEEKPSKSPQNIYSDSILYKTQQ